MNIYYFLGLLLIIASVVQYAVSGLMKIEGNRYWHHFTGVFVSTIASICSSFVMSRLPLFINGNIGEAAIMVLLLGIITIAAYFLFIRKVSKATNNQLFILIIVAGLVLAVGMILQDSLGIVIKLS